MAHALFFEELILIVDTITLDRDYKYQSYRAIGEDNTVIDAEDATWSLSNMGRHVNRYPVSVYDSDNVILRGGTIEGNVSLHLDWRAAYVNSAAIFARNSVDVLVEDWRVSQAWDGIRIRGDARDTFTVDSVWLSDVRDDAIENDDGLGGTIKGSLFDGVFVGLSVAEPGLPVRSGNSVVIDDVLMRMESFLYKGSTTHHAPFKVRGNSPELEIYDSVFAIEEIDHHGKKSLARAWDKVEEAAGNYFLNLSDDPLPDHYPQPPDGFTVLEGVEARAFWRAAREAWIDRNDANEAPMQPPAIVDMLRSDLRDGGLDGVVDDFLL